MNEEVLLSIIVTTYNHENYIEKAINSILMQKVSFRYEVLIADDCSTDNTKLVLKKLEKKLDDRFKIFYREENRFSNHKKYPYGNSGDLKLMSRGKYMIMLEGDDYWIDDRKLQKQVDFLDNNDIYYAVGHNCIMVDNNNNVIDGLRYPVLNKKEYDIKKFPYSYFPGQTASFMYRNPFLKSNESIKDFLLNSNYGVGDKRTIFFCATMGKIAIWYNEYLSAYRYITNGGSSFSANIKQYSYEKQYNNMKSYFDYCCNNEIFGLNRKIAELMYYKILKIGIIKKKISKLDYKRNLSQFIYKKYCFFNFLILALYEKLYLKKRRFKR